MGGAAMTEADIAAFLEAIPLPAMLVGTDDRIIGLNAAGLALLSATQPGRHYFTALRHPAALEAIEACLRDRQSHRIRVPGKDATQDSAFLLTASFVDLSVTAGALVCLEDVTPLEKADRMRRDFVANVSHELRTPLTALLGFIETLQGPARGDQSATDRFLSTMAREASRMERLVRDLLSLSRVESAERMRPRDSVDLGGLLTSVCHVLRPLTEGAGVTVTLDLPDATVNVAGDSDQLRQVFINLIENATKYGGRDRAVAVSLQVQAHDPVLRTASAVVSVHDEGPGIAEEHLPRLTERFYRVDSHRSREMGGTGLGLAIVKHIVNRHRGRLAIDSTPGEGSTFRVILPR